ncbi:MAG: hypothetical protein ABIZ49_04200 [Opitutaceae bacterium]
MTEESVTRTFTVRNRPVGFVEGRWGGSLVAVERGYFPVSPTGYRSLSGRAGAAITAEFLESLANDRDRERRELLRHVRSSTRPERDPLMNFVHVGLTAEKALHDGFFAPDAERAELWPAAHRLFCLIDTDRRFQPPPGRGLWTEAHCAATMARTHESQRFLQRCAAGDFPSEVPIAFFAAQAYLELPAKPGGEPKIDLGGFTAEMAFDLPVPAVAPRRTERRSLAVGATESAQPETQLGLFGSGPITRTAPSVQSGQRVAPRL